MSRQIFQICFRTNNHQRVDRDAIKIYLFSNSNCGSKYLHCLVRICDWIKIHSLVRIKFNWIYYQFIINSNHKHCFKKIQNFLNKIFNWNSTKNHQSKLNNFQVNPHFHVTTSPKKRISRWNSFRQCLTLVFRWQAPRWRCHQKIESWK